MPASVQVTGGRMAGVRTRENGCQIPEKQMRLADTKHSQELTSRRMFIQNEPKPGGVLIMRAVPIRAGNAVWNQTAVAPVLRKPCGSGRNVISPRRVV